MVQSELQLRQLKERYFHRYDRVLSPLVAANRIGGHAIGTRTVPRSEKAAVQDQKSARDLLMILTPSNHFISPVLAEPPSSSSL